MIEFFKLIFPFTSSAENYAASLKKMAIILVYELTAFQIIFLYSDNAVALYDKINLTALLETLQVDFTGLIHYAVAALISILVAIIAHIIKLHDRISNVLHIRERFDVSWIIYPLAIMTGSKMDAFKLNRIRGNRESIMHRIFYKYASSRDDQSIVGIHDKAAAINAWCWFWIIIEAMPFLSLLIAFSLYLGNSIVGLILFAILICYLILAMWQYSHLERYARTQVEKIANDATAAAEIREAFNEI